MPIFNGTEFFSDSLTSIYAQSYTDWELFVGINGHPPDGPFLQSIKKYISKKVHIFDLPNIQNKAETLNHLVKRSRQDHIALLDVDDIWHDSKLEIQMRHKLKYDVVGTNTKYFCERTDHPDIPLGEIDFKIFNTLNPIINSSAILNRQDAGWSTLPEVQGIEDYDLWLRLNKNLKTFYNVPQVLTYHRIHQASFFNNKQYDVDSIRKKWERKF